MTDKNDQPSQEAEKPETFVCDGGRTIVVKEVCPFCGADVGDLCEEAWGR